MSRRYQNVSGRSPEKTLSSYAKSVAIDSLLWSATFILCGAPLTEKLEWTFLISVMLTVCGPLPFRALANAIKLNVLEDMVRIAIEENQEMGTLSPTHVGGADDAAANVEATASNSSHGTTSSGPTISESDDAPIATPGWTAIYICGLLLSSCFSQLDWSAPWQNWPVPSLFIVALLSSIRWLLDAVKSSRRGSLYKTE